MKPGYVYALTNQAMPWLVKIGHTGRCPHQRAAELSGGTGTPVPFTCVAYWEFPDAVAAERYMHAVWEPVRANPSREFFWIPDPRQLCGTAREVPQGLLRAWEEGLDTCREPTPAARRHVLKVLQR